MNAKLFVKQNCPRCPAAKRVVEGLDAVEVYDIDAVEGLAEASFWGVLSTPSLLVVDTSGQEIRSWRGDVPDRAELRELLAN